MNKILVASSLSLGLCLVWALLTTELFSAIFPISGSNGVPAFWEYEASALSRALLYSCISFICAQRLGLIAAFSTAFCIVFAVDTAHWAFNLFGISNSLPQYVESLIFGMFAGLFAPAVTRFKGGRIGTAAKRSHSVAAFFCTLVLGYLFTHANYLTAEWFGGEGIKTSMIGWYVQVSLFVSLLLAITASVSAAMLLNSNKILVLFCVLFLTPWIIYLSPKVAFASASPWHGIVLACVTLMAGVFAGLLTVAWRARRDIV